MLEPFATMAAFLSAVAPATATVVAAIAYYRSQGFPLLEAIGLARQARAELRKIEVHQGKKRSVSAWDLLSDDTRARLDELADRRHRGTGPMR